MGFGKASFLGLGYSSSGGLIMIAALVGFGALCGTRKYRMVRYKNVCYQVGLHL